jgi:hypothetical protein
MLQQAGRFILALDRRRERAGRLAERPISASDGEDVGPGRRTAQVCRSGVEATPQLVGTTSP